MNNPKYTIYVVVWGSWRSWECVKYEYEGCKSRRRYKSPLGALVEYEKCCDKDSIDIIDSILIFLPESLVATLCKEIKNKNDYEEALKDLKDDYGKFVRYGLCIRNKEVEFKILPSKGTFRVEGRGDLLDFETNMADARHIMYYHLMMYITDKLKRLMEDKGDNVELRIILDLTNSINYFQSLAFDNIMRLLGMMEILRRVVNFNFTLKVINSDPVVRGLKNQVPRINTLYEGGGVFPGTPQARGRLSEPPISPYLPLIDPEGDLITARNNVQYNPSNLEREVLHTANYISQSYHRNAPLALLYAPLDTFEEDAKSLIKKIINIYEEGLEVEHKQGRTIIRRTYQLTDTFHNLVTLYGFATLFNKSEYSSVYPPTLYQLCDFSWKLYHRDEVRRTMIVQEIMSIASEVCDKMPRRNADGGSTSILLSRLENYKEDFHDILREFRSGKGSRHVRNFIAHGGLLYQLCCLKYNLESKPKNCSNKPHDHNCDDIGNEDIKKVMENTLIYYVTGAQCLYKYFLNKSL